MKKIWNWCKLRLGRVIVSLHDQGMIDKFSRFEIDTFYDGEFYCPICNGTKLRPFYKSNGCVIGCYCRQCDNLIKVPIAMQDMFR